MGISSAVFEQRARDKTFEVEVASLEPMADGIRKVTPELCVKGGKLHVPAADRWADMNRRMAN
eukprot:461895-Heterocapsa_arctica.AAC.1